VAFQRPFVTRWLGRRHEGPTSAMPPDPGSARVDSGGGARPQQTVTTVTNGPYLVYSWAEHGGGAFLWSRPDPPRRPGGARSRTPRWSRWR